MNYPNQRQWAAIWIGAGVAFLCVMEGLFPVALGIIGLTALLVWQLSEPAAAPQPGLKFCSECGKPMPEAAKFCAECGTESVKAARS